MRTVPEKIQKKVLQGGSQVNRDAIVDKELMDIYSYSALKNERVADASTKRKDIKGKP